MENNSMRDHGRTLSFVVSSSVFIYHVAIAYLCTYIPTGTVYVTVSVTGYAWYSCVLSFLGVLGSIKRSPILLTIFSNHLLIDTILSLVPKIGLLYLFHEFTSDLCLDTLPSSFWVPTDDSSLHGPGRVMPSPDTQQWIEASKARRNCQLTLSFARVLLLGVLVLWTTAQWGLGLYIRRYAVRLGLGTHVEVRDSATDLEKSFLERAFYDEDSLADEYHEAVKTVSGWTTRNGCEKSPIVIIHEDRKA